MCTTCGCGGDGARIDGVPIGDHEHGHEHVHADGTRHAHPHAHDSAGTDDHAHAHDAAPAWRHAPAPASGVAPSGFHRHADGSIHADHAQGPLGAAHAPGMSAARVVEVEEALLAKNDAIAAQNRRRLAELRVFALNFVSSPGSGKTTLLCRTIEAWGERSPVAVVEGDQQTSFDADRIRATGAAAVQVNTGKGCHLDAAMVARAIDRLAPKASSLLFIENVGNLVCPAAFDLGEAHKVVILSVTEGEDKPLKYPDMFRAADLLLVNKVDLLPYLRFDVAKAVEYARRVRPGLPVIEISATSGAGFAAWLSWLEQGLAGAAGETMGELAGTPATDVERLERRVAELEARLAALGHGV